MTGVQTCALPIYSGNGQKNKKIIRLFLIVSASVLVVALAVGALLLTGNIDVNQDRIQRVIEYGTVLRGVSVAGVDISGMTEQEARDATASIESDLLSVAMITIDVDGQLFKYDAVDFDLHTGYDKAIADATAFGHSGSFDERKQASDNAKNEGADFAVDVYLDEDKAKKMVSTLKALVDTEPVEAGFEFMPYG